MLTIFFDDFELKSIAVNILSFDLENTDHHPRVMGCINLTTKDIRLSNIHQTTNPLLA